MRPLPLPAVCWIALALCGCDAETAADAGLADAAVEAVCGRNTCTTGCCDADGRCRRDDDIDACGTDGRACAPCLGDERCLAGLCVTDFASAEGCDARTCRGCCSGRQCVATPSDAYCGAAGGRCGLCAFHEQCVDGACALDPDRCGPHNCAGCCEDGYTCVGAPTVALCGSGGRTCENCPEGGYRDCVDGLCVR